jgi:protein arginine kinase
VKLDDLTHRSAVWLDGSGPESSIVLSSRVRLARNLSDVPFTNRSSAEQQQSVLEKFRHASEKAGILRRGALLQIDHLSMLDRAFLQERHLISPTLMKMDLNSGLYVDEREMVSVMVNEEDHLRLQVMQSGLRIQSTWEIIDRIDDQLSDHLKFAFSEQYGYLTACPTNVGTGMRASVLIHLPALVLTKDIDQVIKGIGQVGLAVRGFYGEGTEVLGNLFQVSNQATLGRTEEDIVDSVQRFTNQIIDFERKARETLLSEARHQIEDKIWRAYGLLQNARVLSSQELMSLISAVRLGVSLEIITTVSIATLNALMVLMQPAHLQKLFQREMDTNERDIRRAELVREKLKSLAPDDGSRRASRRR